MTYCPYPKNCEQAIMIASPNKLQHVSLTGYTDHVPSSYKNLMMYPSWQWPPTPEGLSSFRLPPIQSRYNPMHSIPSPLTPGSMASHASMRPVEPLSPLVQHPCPPGFSPNVSPSAPLTQISSAKDASLTSTPTGSKRGRPRADVISSLQYFGSNSTCSIRCHICHRVFPREKSLQAHLRTHTGERPYRCDYPNCTKSFVQSGQLKTHQRLHSGEKPFKCSGEGCQVRFTHANRHCPDHPQAKLLRDDQGALEGLLSGVQKRDSSISEWLNKYVRSRLDRTSSIQPRSMLKKEFSEQSGSSDDERKSDSMKDSPLVKSPISVETHSSSVKRQLLSDENTNNQEVKALDPVDPAVRIPLSPKRINQNGQVPKIDPRHPMKKRILAYNQMLLKENQEKSSNARAVQRPILPPVDVSPKQKIDIENRLESLRSVDSEVYSSPKRYSFLGDLDSSPRKTSKSPSANDSTCFKDSSCSEPLDKWNGALALMQLASSPPSRKFSNS